MNLPERIFNAFLLSASLALVGCGGGDTPTTPVDPTATTISGTAQAPAGSIAQIDQHKPFMLATLDFVMPPVWAAVTGLTPITNATVELIRIDDDGNQVGAVLASVTTDSIGGYTLELPTGVELAADLVIQIKNSSNTPVLRAIVSGTTVNIDPVSQFIVDTLINEPGVVLANLNLATVQGLVAQVAAIVIDLSSSTTLEGAVTTIQGSSEITQAVNGGIASVSNRVNLVGAWGSGSGPGMLVIYPDGFYMNYATDTQDCPNGGVEYGSYSYDGNEMTVTPGTDENGVCGLSVNGAAETYTVGISNNGNQLDITFFDPDTQANATSSFPRVTDGNPDSIVGGWDIGGSLTTPQAIVFYPNGTYIHWQETGSDEACTPGGVEYGSYSFDGSSISGSIDRDENNDCGLGAGTGGLTFPSTTVVNNVLTFNNGELFVFDRLETSNSATGGFSINMTGKTATSVIIYSECPSDPLGWTYTFTSSSMTLTGSDGWQTPGCTALAEETLSEDMTTIASDFDIPFNCAGYPVCTASDFNQSISGIDQDNRSFTAVYSFNQTTNELTYIKSVEGRTFTETITIQ